MRALSAFLRELATSYCIVAAGACRFVEFGTGASFEPAAADAFVDAAAAAAVEEEEEAIDESFDDVAAAAAAAVAVVEPSAAAEGCFRLASLFAFCDAN